MLEGGASLRVIQDILGHSDLGTTQIYTHVAPAYLAKEARLHPRTTKRHGHAVLTPGPTICSDCRAKCQEGFTRCDLHIRLNNEASLRARGY